MDVSATVSAINAYLAPTSARTRFCVPVISNTSSSSISRMPTVSSDVLNDSLESQSRTDLRCPNPFQVIVNFVDTTRFVYGPCSIPLGIDRVYRAITRH
jgi:hypothetical protein